MHVCWEEEIDCCHGLYCFQDLEMVIQGPICCWLLQGSWVLEQDTSLSWKLKDAL